MLLHKNSVYKPVVALTPKQKDMKKDYLLQRSVQKSKSRGIPSWEEVKKMVLNESGDNFGYELEWKLDESEESIEEAALGLLAKETKDPELKKYILEDKELPLDCPREVDDRLDELKEEVTETEVLKDYQSRYDGIALDMKRFLAGAVCYRLIQVLKSVDPTTLNGLGIYWSLDENKVGIYESREALENKPNETTYWRLSARINLKAVDTWETVMAFMNPEMGKAEDEVRFLKHAPIYVYVAEEILGYDRQGSGPSLEMAGYDVGRVIYIDGMRRC